MTGRPTFWFALAGFIMVAAPADGQEAAPPLPDRNPARVTAPARDVAEAPVVPDPAVPDEGETNGPDDEPTLPWLAPKVNEALLACSEMLEGAVLEYEQLPPIKSGACGTPAPILVKSIGADPAVVVEPPATVNCTLAAKLDAWLRDEVQPAALAAFGEKVVKIHNVLSYECRRRYGGTNTKISEHAFANALDISEFVLASGEHVTVRDSWPRVVSSPDPPAPDPNPARVAAAEPTGAIMPASNTPPAASSMIEATKVKADPAAPPMPPPVAKPPAPKPSAATLPARKSTFVHEIHADACKTFNTVLGPSANAAHKDHFHLDMKVRRYVKICDTAVRN